MVIPPRTLSANLREYQAWDLPVRCFHWINALSVFLLLVIGLIIFNGEMLELSQAGKVTLKIWHVTVGYVFLANLAVRLIWGFIGGPYARWRVIVPWGRGYPASLRRSAVGFFSGRPEPYVGHNPLGRIAVGVLLLALLVQGLTGLVLAGTDLYYPPLGHWFASWVAAPGVNPGEVLPYRPDLVDAAAYDAMRQMRTPVIAIHKFGLYVMSMLVVVHVSAVIFTEIRGGGTLVSGMISGRKVLSGTPPDADDSK
jgi:Ni/Fe-hydrogenase 1 B-type cytochrome subunit